MLSPRERIANWGNWNELDEGTYYMLNYLLNHKSTIELTRDIHNPQEELRLFLEDCVGYKNEKIE